MREVVVLDGEQRFEWLLPRRAGWLGIGRHMATWFGPGLDVERRVQIITSGQPAVSPDGALLAFPISDAVQVHRDDGDLR